MRFIQHPETLKLVPADEYVRPKKQESGPFIIPDIEPYDSPIDGRIINSRHQRREDFKRHNCRPYEGREQEEKEAARQRAYGDKKADAIFTDAIERTMADMPRHLREALEN
jgi:hypothetical protein